MRPIVDKLFPVEIEIKYFSQIFLVSLFDESDIIFNMSTQKNKKQQFYKKKWILCSDHDHLQKTALNF